jgi:2-succinyl-5-enolpyruvyl-6-hydroxy-3-cyclohexene-1-carboxylate synthase
VDALANAGVRHVCVSPGSRSAPLTLALARQHGLTTSVHIDERSAAFFALGYGRASGLPAAVVCTSGTAAANYLPAVIEAHYSRVPLILLTADRPPELRDTGAWQAIDQIKLYGPYVRWFAEVATPDAAPHMLRYVRHLAGRAVATARGRPAGAVHLNFPFREPLTISQTPDEVASLHQAWNDRPPPATRTDSALLASNSLIADLATRLAAEPRGLILCGPIDPPPGYGAAVAQLAAATGYPVLAEPLSGLRFGPHDRSQVITGYDAFLRDTDWCADQAPGLVLRFGGSLTWRSVALFLEGHLDATHWLVDPDGAWDDPARLATLHLPVDPVPLCEAVTARLIELGHGPPAGGNWLARWQAAGQSARGIRDELVRDADVSTVAWVYPALLDALPDDALLYAANSMAVRDLDSFTDRSPKRLRALANRGAAGIDGTLSSALGAALANPGAATMLVTGDLAFLHDLNGLGAGHLPGLSATIVVLNDDGGGIFAYLPVAGHAPEALEPYFLTPTGADLAAACATYGIAHERVTERAGFEIALAASLAAPGVQVIELPIDRSANTALHLRYWADVAASL